LKTPEKVEVTLQPQNLPTPEPVKRGTILSYFKRLPPSRNDTESVTPSPIVDVEVPPTPSSPPPELKPRKRRRLQTRPNASLLASTSYDRIDRDSSSEYDVEASLEASPESTLAPVSPADSHELILDTIVCGGTTETEVTEAVTIQKPEKTRLGKRSRKEMVQTTLSLSINPGPGFNICNECGVLYNPLNEKDRLEHKKQHAAYLRNKNKPRPTESLS